MTLDEAAAAYMEKFQDCPTIVGMPPGVEEQAIEALQGAIEDDRPFLDDADFYNTLGLDPPPDDEDSPT